MFKMFTIMLGLAGVTNVFAFPCFLTLAKDSCWLNYNVTVDVLAGHTGHVLVSALVPQGTAWTRVKFDCKPGETLTFSASFTPIFWENDDGKHYEGLNERTLPEAPGAGETAWNIKLCYPQEFAQGPFPPEGNGSCACDMGNIPPIEPQ